jgi:hypothetical protein
LREATDSILQSVAELLRIPQPAWLQRDDPFDVNSSGSFSWTPESSVKLPIWFFGVIVQDSSKNTQYLQQTTKIEKYWILLT